MSGKQRCPDCGYRTDDEVFFHGERDRACLACPEPPWPSIRPAKRRYLVSVLGLALAVAMGIAEVRDGRPAMVAGIACLLIGYWLSEAPALVIHEGAHALISLLVGARVHVVRVGRGATAWFKDVGETRFELGEQLLGGGHVIRYFPAGAAARWRIVAISAAGAVANALTALLLLAVMAAQRDLHEGRWILGLMGIGAVFCQLRHVWWSAWPRLRRRGAAAGDYVDNDARFIVETLRGDPAEVQAKERLTAGHCEGDLPTRVGRYADAAAYFRRRWAAAPQDGAAACSWLDRVSKAQGHAAVVYEGVTAGLGKAGAARLDDPCWALAETNIAWSAVQTEDAGLLPLADSLSRQTFEAFPKVAAIAGTRGAVLTAMGDAEAGAPLLRIGARGSEDPGEKAVFCRWLERAETALGHEALAAAYGRYADWRSGTPPAPLERTPVVATI